MDGPSQLPLCFHFVFPFFFLSQNKWHMSTVPPETVVTAANSGAGF